MNIKKFKFENEFYIYIDVTGQMVRINEVVYKTLNSLISMSGEDYVERYIGIFRNAREIYNDFQTLLSSIDDKDAVYFKPEVNAESICPEAITLCITENCNFRCSYCIYGGSYEENKLRKHSSKVMTYEIAIAAIQKVYEICLKNGRKDLLVGFYGGEPLLNMDLIEKIVQYCSTLNLNIRYAITTNGYLLDSENIEYLVKHAFNISISFDGLKEIHDKHRVHANGTFTYNIVERNIELIKSKIDKHSQNILLLATVTNLDEYNKLVDLRKNLKLNLRISRMHPTHDERKQYYTEYFLNSDMDSVKGNSEIFDLVQGLKSGDMSLDNHIFMDSLSFIHKREYGEYISYKTCVPGNQKLFVSSEGSYYICEKIDHDFKIGSVEDGLDYQGMSVIVNKWIEFREKTCANCWARYLCSSCYINFASDGSFKNNIYECLKFRKQIENLLKVYIFLLKQVGQHVLEEYYVKNQVTKD